MEDRERIEALASDGRITREEADRLLNVLADIDRTEQQLGEVDEDMRLQGEGQSGEAQPESQSAYRSADQSATQNSAQSEAQSEAQISAQSEAQNSARNSPQSATQSATRSAEMKWVDIELLAGDLRIDVDESLQEPSVRGKGPGNLSLEQSERGARLSGGLGRGRASGIGRLLDGVAGGSVRLSLPTGWGVKLDMKAGDVKISGPLAYLAGNLLAGDLDADQLHGVDLSVKAGDIDLGLLLDEGDHRVQAVAGDIDVTLLKGSNVSVRGRVNIGAIGLPQGWEHGWRGVGSRVEQTVGEGAAGLILELGTGDLKIGTADD